MESESYLVIMEARISMAFDLVVNTLWWIWVVCAPILYALDRTRLVNFSVKKKKSNSHCGRTNDTFTNEQPSQPADNASVNYCNKSTDNLDHLRSQTKISHNHTHSAAMVIDQSVAYKLVIDASGESGATIPVIKAIATCDFNKSDIPRQVYDEIHDDNSVAAVSETILTKRLTEVSSSSTCSDIVSSEATDHSTDEQDNSTDDEDDTDCYQVDTGNLIHVCSTFVSKHEQSSCYTQNMHMADGVPVLHKLIVKAQTLMSQHNYTGAIDTLNKGISFAQQSSEPTSRALKLLVARCHEYKSLCFYQQGLIIESMQEMDAAVGVARVPDATLMDSTNQCFQLFHEWCLENREQYQMEILQYYNAKKDRLASCLPRMPLPQNAVHLPPTNIAESGTPSSVLDTGSLPTPGDLLEAVHCYVLGQSLCRLEMSDEKDLELLLILCQTLYNQLASSNCTTYE